MAHFELPAFNRLDKRVWITTPNAEFQLCLDYDDVNHFTAVAHLQKMFAILNDHWDDPQYVLQSEPSRPDEFETDEEEDAWATLRNEQANAIMQGLVAK